MSGGAWSNAGMPHEQETRDAARAGESSFHFAVMLRYCKGSSRVVMLLL